MDISQHTMAAGMGAVGLLNFFQATYLGDNNGYAVASFGAISAAVIESMRYIDKTTKEGRESRLASILEQK